MLYFGTIFFATYAFFPQSVIAIDAKYGAVRSSLLLVSWVIMYNTEACLVKLLALEMLRRIIFRTK